MVVKKWRKHFESVFILAGLFCSQFELMFSVFACSVWFSGELVLCLIP